MALATGAKVWFVGDSKTKGDPTQSGTTYANCYRRRTINRLDAMGLTGLVLVGTQTDTDGVKHDGVNNTTLLQHYTTVTTNYLSQGSPNLVVIDGGTNDAGAVGSFQTGQTLCDRVEDIVDWLLATDPTVRVLVAQQTLVYPPSQPVSAGIIQQNAALYDFNRLMPTMVAGKDQTRTRWFRSDFLQQTDTYDNVHPNQDGSDKRAVMAASQIQRWTQYGWLAPWTRVDFEIMPGVFGPIQSGSDW